MSRWTGRRCTTGDFNRIEGILSIPVPDGELLISNRVTGYVKAKFEDWLEGNARRRPFQLRKAGELDEEEFKDSMSSVDESCAAGLFKWGSQAWLKSLKQLPIPWGIIKLLTILGKEAEAAGQKSLKPVTEEWLLELFDTPDVGDYLIKAVQEVLTASPNFRTPPTRGTASQSRS